MKLFICKANVWRSQIAEAFYNNKYWKWASTSIAWCEARKEKYKWIPETSIVDFMLNNYSISMNWQSIKYLSDIEEFIEKIDEIIYLYNPNKKDFCNGECEYKNQSPINFFLSIQVPIRIYEITDPFSAKSTEYKKIYQSIYSIIDKLT